MRSFKLFGSAVAAMVFALAGCAHDRELQTGQTSPAETSTPAVPNKWSAPLGQPEMPPSMDSTAPAEMLIEWIPFEDLRALTKGSHSVVIASGAALQEVLQEPDPPGLHKDKAGSGLIESMLSLRVDQVVYAPADVVAGSEVFVQLPGGNAGDNAAVNPDGPFLDQNRRYLLFLMDNDHDGVFGIVGGPQGAYLVDDGILQAAGNTVGPVTDTLVGKPLDEVLAQIAELRQ